jgi:hypothetical protein
MKQKKETINAEVNKIYEVGLGHTITCTSNLTSFIFINGIHLANIKLKQPPPNWGVKQT